MTSNFQIDRGLAANEEAEKGTIGAVLMDNANYYACAEVRPWLFSKDSDLIPPGVLGAAGAS